MDCWVILQFFFTSLFVGWLLLAFFIVLRAFGLPVSYKTTQKALGFLLYLR